MSCEKVMLIYSVNVSVQGLVLTGSNYFPQSAMGR